VAVAAAPESQQRAERAPKWPSPQEIRLYLTGCLGFELPVARLRTWGFIEPTPVDLGG
jgi:hypothetical protein